MFQLFILFYGGVILQICRVFHYILIKRNDANNGILYIYSKKISLGLRREEIQWKLKVKLSQVGFVVDRVALGQIFSEYFGFPR
jgi:hypothetical protein